MLINAIGTYSASQPLESMAITRREPGPQDVQIAIAYCGVCHSDLHQARSEWAGTHYPCVPGHEIVGRVTAVGNAVSRYAVGVYDGDIKALLGSGKVETLAVDLFVLVDGTCYSDQRGLDLKIEEGKGIFL